MNEKYLSVLLIITILSIGIISSSNMVFAQSSYASPPTGTTSGMNSQDGALGSNSSMNSSAASNFNNNSQAASNMNSQPGTLASTLVQNSATSNPTASKSGSQNTTGNNQIMFTETGLHTGWGVCWPFWSCVPSWSVIHNGQTNNATTDTLSVSAPSGVYSYTVVSPTGYSVSQSSGKLMVSGIANQTIHFVSNP